MKEIKFRAWDGEKMYVPPNDLEHTIGMLRYTDPDTIVGIAFGKNFGDCDYTSENARNMIFMQYTGLKDTNGLEIYEGDIVLQKRSFIYHGDWVGKEINDGSDFFIDGDRAIYYGVLYKNIGYEDYKNNELLDVVVNRYRIFGQRLGIVFFGEYDYCDDYYTSTHNGWGVKPVIVRDNKYENAKDIVPIIYGLELEVIGNIYQNPELLN